MNFDTCFTQLMLHEGGYVNDPNDPGGETNFGVTKRVAREYGYTGAMSDLPLELARRIAKEKYWDAVKAEIMPAVIQDDLFDAAFHSGPKQAIVWLQRAAGVKADGEIGPATLEAVHAMSPETLARRFLGHRLRFMTDLKNWAAHGRGWSRRIADLLMA